LYWILLTHVAAPGETPGSLLPGRDIGAYLDRILLGVNHLSREGHGGDPAGLLGTIPATAGLLLGAIAGAWTSSTRSPRAKWLGLLGAGLAALALGLLWGRSFPINKSLWTSSYVVYTAGWSALLLGACYWLVEVRRSRRWIGSFVRFGRHALLVYFLSEVTTSTLDLIGARSSAYHLLQRSSASAPMASLAYALLYVSCWAVLLRWVERTRVRVRA
jgi:predicted acyltransferase